LGNLSEAEAACQQAVLASQNVNELLEIGRVDLQRARVEIAKNAPERARPHLLAARDIFSRIRASLDLEWVDALLEKIESAAVEPIGMSGEEFSHDTA
jgi:flagellin-specific chaperone FliS